MLSKELLLTINYSFTYEVAVNTDVVPEIIKGYPKTKDKMPVVLVNAIEYPHDNKYCELVDKFITVEEAVDVEKALLEG